MLELPWKRHDELSVEYDFCELEWRLVLFLTAAFFFSDSPRVRRSKLKEGRRSDESHTALDTCAVASQQASDTRVFFSTSTEQV